MGGRSSIWDSTTAFPCSLPLLSPTQIQHIQHLISKQLVGTPTCVKQISGDWLNSGTPKYITGHTRTTRYPFVLKRSLNLLVGRLLSFAKVHQFWSITMIKVSRNTKRRTGTAPVLVTGNGKRFRWRQCTEIQVILLSHRLYLWQIDRPRLCLRIRAE